MYSTSGAIFEHLEELTRVYAKSHYSNIPSHVRLRTDRIIVRSARSQPSAQVVISGPYNL